MFIILERVPPSMPVASVSYPPRLCHWNWNEGRRELEDRQGNNGKYHSDPFFLTCILLPSIQNIADEGWSMDERVQGVQVVEKMIYRQIKESTG